MLHTNTQSTTVTLKSLIDKEEYNSPNTDTNTNTKPKVPWLNLLVTVIVISVYCLIFAAGRSPLFVFSSWMLMVLCMCFVMIEQPLNSLAPANVASLLYAVSFAAAPMWLADLGAYHHRYFGNEVEDLLGMTSVMTLVGYVFFLIGYFVYIHIRGRMRIQTIGLSIKLRRYLRLCLFVAGVVGTLFYIMLIIQSGGIGRLLGYSGGRADIFGSVYGGWFWGAHILFVAYGLFAILAMQKHPWLCLVLALVLAASFVPFQGRDLVVAPIFCWLIFYHLMRNSVSWKAIGVGAFSIILIASLLGAYRGGVIRDDAGSFFSTFFETTGASLTKTVSANIEQLDTAMTAVRYVEKEGHTIGPMVLFSWAEPLDRALLGNNIPSIYSGVFIDLLLYPEHKGWNTAASPSLPGELFIGMGWFGVAAGMLLYGLVFGQLTRWCNKMHYSPVLFAAYPFVLYILSKMIVDGTTHLFRLIIVLAILYIFALFAPLSKSTEKNFNKETE